MDNVIRVLGAALLLFGAAMILMILVGYDMVTG
jgi:hypothetical protein